MTTERPGVPAVAALLRPVAAAVIACMVSGHAGPSGEFSKDWQCKYKIPGEVGQDDVLQVNQPHSSSPILQYIAQLESGQATEYCTIAKFSTAQSVG